MANGWTGDLRGRRFQGACFQGVGGEFGLAERLRRRPFKAISGPLGSLRLAAQDVALSRRKRGFESPRERQSPYISGILVWLGSTVSHPHFDDFERPDFVHCVRS